MTRLTLKCGDIEVDYEGSDDFLKQELPGLIKAIAQLQGSAPPRRAPADKPMSIAAEDAKSVSTVAQKLGVKNGPDLIMATALSISLSGSDTFTKKAVRDGMRSAKTFFRSAYMNNFDNYINRLVKKGRLNHSGGENYALPEAEATKLKADLAK